MARKQRVTNEMRAFLPFLQRMERQGKAFSAADIAKATGYKLKGSVKAKLSRGEWQAVLHEVDKDQYEAYGTLGLDEQQFARLVSVRNQLSSTKDRRSPSSLAERLFAKAKDNFILALELYNRPSLENRLEAFSMLFCTAWEQLLKGKLIEDRGEGSIYRKGGRTLSLATCCEMTYPKKSDPVRKNLEVIKDFRDMGTHLIMPELGVAYSPVFQAGVMNFIKAYHRFTGTEVLPVDSVGLLSLTTGAAAPSAVDLKLKYGSKLGTEVAAIIEQVNFRVQADGRNEFAIHVSHGLHFVKEGEADLLVGKDPSSDGKVVVVEKARDPSKELTATEVVKHVNKILKDRLSTTQRKTVFSHGDRERNEMNLYDLQVICTDQKWQHSNNEFHTHHKTLNRRTYSLKAVNWIVDKLVSDPAFLSHKKASYVSAERKKRSK